jgi:transcriptional regulator with XRE-family HTH domain
MPEKLSAFVRRLIHEKDLTHAEVAARSRHLITDGYIRDIISEKTTNPSVAKLKALARGLGVNEDEVFDVARGVDPSKRGHHSDWFLDNLLKKFSDLQTSDKNELMPTLKMLDREVDERLAQIVIEKPKKKAS